MTISSASVFGQDGAATAIVFIGREPVPVFVSNSGEQERIIRILVIVFLCAEIYPQGVDIMNRSQARELSKRRIVALWKIVPVMYAAFRAVD
jgi:hypothetical protein